jgi:A/G-specific adenine glycosylase
VPSFDHAAVSRKLLSWFPRNGRSMEWRETTDPYRIWLSEILLQQTRVASAAPYYRRFVARFPTVERLASAAPGDVLAAWEGLGYYARARNLHAAARIVVGRLGGRIPDTAEGLAALPGVGRSTAGAVAAIAFGRDEAILDGNARRLLCRLAALREDPRSPSAERTLWDHSKRLVLPGRGRDTALAVMDLGAVVCLPRNPACTSCPLREECGAARLGLQAEIPAGRSSRPVPSRSFHVAVVDDGRGNVLAGTNPDRGLLGGMTAFPTFPSPSVGAVDEAHVSRAVGFPVRSLGGPVTIRRLYTHFEGIYEALLYVSAGPSPPPPPPGFAFLPPDGIDASPMGRAHRKIWQEIRILHAHHRKDMMGK